MSKQLFIKICDIKISSPNSKENAYEYEPIIGALVIYGPWAVG